MDWVIGGVVFWIGLLVGFGFATHHFFGDTSCKHCGRDKL